MSLRALPIVVVLIAAGSASADERVVAFAMRDYYATLAGRGGNIESVRDRIVPNFAKCSRDTQASVLRQIDRGFNRKYRKSTEYHKVLAEILAGCGRPGIIKLKKRLRAEKRRHDLRRVIVEALGECGDHDALDAILMMIHDREPAVAAAAVRACGKHASVEESKRKAMARDLVDRFLEITSATMGKKADSPQVRYFQAVEPAMLEALRRISGGESYDSAKAWESWLDENWREDWPEPAR